jgi:hypothetical protein
MSGPRIALVTPFPPVAGGGGSIIYRSLLPHLEDAEIRWFYLADRDASAPSSTWLGPNLLGGSMAVDAMNSAKLFVAQRHSAVGAWVKRILNWSPDIVWLSAMNEGLLLGKKLSESGVKHLHVSVHDDPAAAAHRSRRYRHLALFIDRCHRELLQRANTVEVVSEGMRRYYHDRWGIESGVVYRYVKDFRMPDPGATDEQVVTIGHAGSAYSAPEVFAFLGALRSISQADGTVFRVLNFGNSPAFVAAAARFPEIVVNAGNVPESTVVEQLQQCRFLYSMYSFSERHRIFRETSQPTKMSTYLMAAKPILAHCPLGSSTNYMLSRYRLGISIASMETAAIADAIRQIMKLSVEADEVHQAAAYYCGSRNLDFLHQCFGLRPAAMESQP